MKQNTLANKVSCVGVGLHSGSHVQMSLCPAAADSGIIFRRLDVSKKHALVPARYDAVCETRLGTTIANAHGVTVATIEHLMAALWGAGIDNAIVDLDGPEVPIMDGSSEPFTFMIECAGLKPLAAKRRMLRVVKAVEIRDGKSFARVAPNLEGDEGSVLDIEIEYKNTLIERQFARYDFREMNFKQVISRARTFGFEHEVVALRKQGLALGGSLDNAVVVGKDKVLNKEGLRYRDEFIRHKALDCLGDLYLSGLRIDGAFTFVRPGHALNNALLKALFADPSAYAVVDADGELVSAFADGQAAVPAYL
jgi:UDP-3-O-[3-hydroxymyristoyl] N-acetylglucosamine deacetylase